VSFKYRILIFIFILIWFTGIFIESIACFIPELMITIPFIKNGYSLTCHQNPQKILHIFCGNSFVCARCLGIYFGLVILSFYNLFSNIKRVPTLKTFSFLALPMLLDAFLTTAGIYPYSKLSAFATGFLFGSILFFYFYNGIILLQTEQREK
jgi:uncharacterized membrane protein